MELPQSEIANDVYQVEITCADLAVEKSVIAARLGYQPDGAPAPFAKMIDEALAGAPGRLQVRAGYRLLPVRRDPGRRNGILAGEVFLHTQKIVAAELRKAEQAAVFVCTIGAGLETWAAELTRSGEPALGFIVDSAASEFAEQTAAALHDHIAAVLAARGLAVTNRYSPGYCNWDVAEQRLLFSLLPAGFCGIRLTDSALMLPIKSVSGIIGAGREAERRDYRCDHCGVADCVYRTIRLAENKRRGKL
jgi:hypothetical protein